MLNNAEPNPYIIQLTLSIINSPAPFLYFPIIILPIK